jgi:hypothetical protein
MTAPVAMIFIIVLIFVFMVAPMPVRKDHPFRGTLAGALTNRRAYRCAYTGADYRALRTSDLPPQDGSRGATDRGADGLVTTLIHTYTGSG